MIAVIFEVEPEPAYRQEYLDIAARLHAELETMDGFVSVERFESLSRPGVILSLSFWRDEDAVARWRNLEAHRLAQARGRAGGRVPQLPLAGGGSRARLRAGRPWRGACRCPRRPRLMPGAARCRVATRTGALGGRRWP